MTSLDDLARLFDLSVNEDTVAGGLTITVRNQTIVLTAGQALASVGGRLVSLVAPPVREGRTWYVPIDFVARAIAPLYGTRIELRKPSRLFVCCAVRFSSACQHVRRKPKMELFCRTPARIG